MKLFLLFPIMVCLTWLLDILNVKPIHIILLGLAILITMLIGGLTLAIIGDIWY